MESQPDSAANRKVTSIWSLASMMAAIGSCCPPMALLAVAFGVRALLQIRTNADVGGRKMAQIGIVIGVAATVLWIGVFVWWHFNARVPMMHGPREALRAGQGGDVASFEQAFHRPIAGDIDAAATFLQQVSARYGRLQDSMLSAHPRTTAAMSGAAEIPVSYTLVFERQQVEADAVFITFAPAKALPQPIFRWKTITIYDPERGDLTYPPLPPGM